MSCLEAEDHPDIFVQHTFPEHIVDLGEIRMNYAVTGDPAKPALLLGPAQTESWWSYEEAMGLRADQFQVFAVDLRGQGRSTWTPGRYSVDIVGGDLVRFIDRVIGRPVIVSGLSSGGVITAWLSAFAPPGQVRAAIYEDAPLFASQTNPLCGQSINQAMGPVFRLWHKWLGSQWSIGDWPGLLADVKVPVLFTHHFHEIDPLTGNLVGALSDVQVDRVRQLVTSAGNEFSYRSFPDMPHSMHGTDPATYVTTITTWLSSLDLPSGR